MELSLVIKSLLLQDSKNDKKQVEELKFYKKFKDGDKYVTVWFEEFVSLREEYLDGHSFDDLVKMAFDFCQYGSRLGLYIQNSGQEDFLSRAISMEEPRMAEWQKNFVEEIQSPEQYKIAYTSVDKELSAMTYNGTELNAENLLKIIKNVASNLGMEKEIEFTFAQNLFNDLFNKNLNNNEKKASIKLDYPTLYGICVPISISILNFLDIENIDITNVSNTYSLYYEREKTNDPTGLIAKMNKIIDEMPSILKV